MDKKQEIKSLEKIAALFGTTPEELYEKAKKSEDISESLKVDFAEDFLKLSSKERDVLTLRFGLKDGRKKTLEEVGNLIGATKVEIRQIEAKAIKNLKKLAQDREVAQDNTKNSDTLKSGDIINVSLKMTPQIPEEDEDKFEINLYDYPINYSISYDYLDSGFTDLSFTEDAGCSSFSDIKDYLEQYLTDDIKEIDEYEIFDIDNVGEYQTAKIKVKSVKEI